MRGGVGRVREKLALTRFRFLFATAISALNYFIAQLRRILV
jgi:hypothetical protein